MKFRIALAAIIVATLGLNVSAMANSPEQAALIDLEYKWANMAKVNDVDGLNAFIDDAYEADTPMGKETKSAMLKPVPADMAQNLRNLVATVDGDTATVSGENVMTFGSKPAIRVHFLDKFVRKDGRWRVVSSFVTY